MSQQDPQSPLRQLIEAQAGSRPGHATAYLRGAAHLDRDFRDAVIAELAENPYRVPPPAYGVDLAAVLKECFVARRRATLRGALMIAVPVLLLPVDAAGVFLCVGLVLVVGLFRLAARAMAGATERGAGAAGRDRSGPVARLLTGLIVLAVVAFLGVRLLSGIGPVLEDVVRPHLPAVLLVYALWTLIAAVDAYLRTSLLHLLATGRAPEHPDGQGSAAARVAQLRRQQADPDVIYSDYAPFVGAGVEVDSWSFAIELIPRRNATVPTLRFAQPGAAPAGPGAAPDAAGFTVPAVHARIRAELLRLGAGGDYPGDRLHGIHVDDYVMKGGLRLGPAADWSGTGPGTAFARMAPFARRAAAERLRLAPGVPAPPTWWPDSLDLAAEERLRHYLTTRVGSWEDEVVLTVFSRVQLQGGLLFLESRAFLLPPIARTYHGIDKVMPPSDVSDWLSLVGDALVAAFRLAGDAPRDLVAVPRTAVRTARSRAWYGRMCRTDRVVDHGPRYSVRELAAEPEYQQLFQEMDAQRFLKSIKTRTLTAVRGSLRDAGYRTDEYDARANVVFDRSVHVHGTVTGNVQTGDGANATHQTVTTPQPHVGPSPGGASSGS
ncbi:hypothetical protein [Streptomyces telluris]|uniref:Uncharacterized protein n=1 Tax=Streptomyces telluris TaxID=2720021 RepID=A0A9X2LIZ2_9ACTN|nr:hypothetical protein [Streptomyces telluris]MCQ8771697.1 hypothetical protein [Streptomyces telluris]NJP76185.1 hypothetical protein [Streptomyces telluris]